MASSSPAPAVASFYDEACVARFAAREPLSVSWLARTTSRSASYNDCAEARVALAKFGAKRKAEADLLHVETGRKRVKSGFSGVEVSKVEIALVPRSEPSSESLYCVAPKDATALWFVDAERSKQLMADKGDAGDAFRANRGAKIQQADLQVKAAADWSRAAAAKVKADDGDDAKKAPNNKTNAMASFFPSSTTKKDTTATKKTEKNNEANANAKPDEANAKAKPDEANAKAKPKSSSFFAGGTKAKKPKKDDKAKEPEPAKEKPRRRIIDDDDDDDDEEEEEEEVRVEEPPPQPSKPRLVEKTFVDEQGYLVTHKVWEQPAEPNAPSNPRPVKPPPPKTKKPNLPKPKPKKAKAPPKGQTNVFSFFKKA